MTSGANMSRLSIIMYLIAGCTPATTTVLGPSKPAPNQPTVCGLRLASRPDHMAMASVAYGYRGFSAPPWTIQLWTLDQGKVVDSTNVVIERDEPFGTRRERECPDYALVSSHPGRGVVVAQGGVDDRAIHYYGVRGDEYEYPRHGFAGFSGMREILWNERPALLTKAWTAQGGMFTVVFDVENPEVLLTSVEHDTERSDDFSTCVADFGLSYICFLGQFAPLHDVVRESGSLTTLWFLDRAGQLVNTDGGKLPVVASPIEELRHMNLTETHVLFMFNDRLQIVSRDGLISRSARLTAREAAARRYEFSDLPLLVPGSAACELVQSVGADAAWPCHAGPPTGRGIVKYRLVHQDGVRLLLWADSRSVRLREWRTP